MLCKCLINHDGDWLIWLILLREFLNFKCDCSSSLVVALLIEPLDCQFTEQTDSVLLCSLLWAQGWLWSQRLPGCVSQPCCSRCGTLVLCVLLCKTGLITAPSSLGGCGLSSLSYKTLRDLLLSLRPSPLPLSSDFPSLLSFSLMLPSSPDIYFTYLFCSFPMATIPSPLECELREDRDLSTFLTVLCPITVFVTALLKWISISCW